MVALSLSTYFARVHSALVSERLDDGRSTMGVVRGVGDDVWEMMTFMPPNIRDGCRRCSHCRCRSSCYVTRTFNVTAQYGPRVFEKASGAGTPGVCQPRLRTLWRRQEILIPRDLCSGALPGRKVSFGQQMAPRNRAPARKPHPQSNAFFPVDVPIELYRMQLLEKKTSMHRELRQRSRNGRYNGPFKNPSLRAKSHFLLLPLLLCIRRIHGIDTAQNTSSLPFYGYLVIGYLCW